MNTLPDEILLPFVRGGVVLDNLERFNRLCMSLTGRGKPSSPKEEAKQVFALAAFHRSLVKATGQDSPDYLKDTARQVEKYQEFKPREESKCIAAAAKTLSELKFKKAASGPQADFTTTGEVAPLSQLLAADHWMSPSPEGKISRFSTFSASSAW